MKTEKHETIFSLLMQAEENEKKAIARRIKLENEIYKYFQDLNLLKKEEGQETVEELGFSVTINRPVTYKLDEEKYRVLAADLPEELSIHRIKIELDKLKYNSVKENPSAKKYLKKIENCIESKPGKVSVKVKKI